MLALIWFSFKTKPLNPLIYINLPTNIVFNAYYSIYILALLAL